jgi:hypothetical protein
VLVELRARQMTGERVERVRWFRVSMVGFAVALAMGGLVLLIVASPVALHWIAGYVRDWDVLGNVGQAYGGASAILSGLALCGVVLSAMLQRRQTRIAQLYTARHHQLNLAKLVLENPDSLVIDGVAAMMDPHARSMIVVNLWVANWMTAWQLGTLSESSLRMYSARLFEAEFVRNWWRARGASYAAGAPGRRFVKILTEECERTERSARDARPAPEGGATPGGTDAIGSRRTRRTLAVAAVVVGATAILVRARRRASINARSTDRKR